MIKNSDFKGPLVGLNVIDFGHYYAGPMAAMNLADQGANVLRIVKPGEQELPSRQYRLLNRNKKLLTLDLKRPEGKEQALSLIKRADVMIENFRPAVMQRLGLDYISVKAINPGLIYLSLPGFASTDDSRSHLQAWEGILSAATGIFSAGEPYQSLNFPPVYDSAPICSAAGGIQGAIAVMAALLAREENGLGTLIEVPLVDAGVSLYSNFFPFQSLSADGSSNELSGPITDLKFSSQHDPVKQLEAVETAIGSIPPSCFYTSYYADSDGRMMLFWLWGRPTQIASLFKVIGIDKKVKQEGFVNVGAWETDLDNNLSGDYLYGKMSTERTKRIIALIASKLATRTAMEWEPLMAEAGVPFSMVRTQEEWLALTPMLMSGVNIKMDNGDSVLTVPGRIADLDGPAGELIDTYEEAKVITANEASKLFQRAPAFTIEGKKRVSQKKGDLLKGLKVLDLCNVVAGPTGTNALAQYGAHVIKAESVSELASLMNFMLEQNQGKRSIILDVKTAPGRGVFEKLIRWADVVAHNILDDTAKRLGISQQQLRKINPRVVSCQVTTFGGTFRGGWENRAGYDQIAKVATGMKARFGTVQKPASSPSEWIIADVMGGLCSAFSSLLAVYQQRKTGYAGEARTSLVRGTNYIHLPHMIAEHGRSSGEGHTRLDKGEHCWQRLYQCSDGWLYVGTSEDRAGVLAEKVTGKTHSDDNLLEAVFVTQRYSYWQTKLEEVDIACHRVLTLEDLLEDTEVQKTNNQAADDIASGRIKLLLYQNHPCGQPIISMAPSWVRVGEDYSYRRLTPAPRLGAHTREILYDLGYSKANVDELIRLKVAHEYLPELGGKEKYFFEPAK